MADTTSNLRNEDFRKLLASTPRRSGGVGETPARDGSGTVHSFSHRHQPKPEKKKGGHGHKHKKEKTEDDDDGEDLKEIMKNYRDRALERRTKGTDDPDEAAKLAAAYRAVPGDSRAVTDKANLRKQVIEESKYLGGDMEHTHLVKGLDFSLLHKVRSEIVKSQNDAEVGDDLEKVYAQTTAAAATTDVVVETENKMVRNLNRVLFKHEYPLRNELFGKGRMAYVVDMEEEEADIPTTLLRSLQDCPKAESNANINANNMLISKLTQVLSYLRADHKKKKKHEMTEDDQKKYQNQSIFDNETDYVPKRERDRERERRDERDKDRRKDRNYFDEKERDRERRDKDYDRDRRDKDRRSGREPERDRERKDRDKEKDKERERERKEREDAEKEKRIQEKMEKRRKETEDGGYDECYPGGLAEMEGGWDSDEEDFSKMDLGNKKPPVKRWDFEDQEEYEKYQGGREAMPKAAYQFGLKPKDGRKSAKSVDTNKKIDRELNQIHQINEKRKAGGDEGGDYKKPKY